MSKQHEPKIETDDKNPAEDAALSRRQLLGIAGQAACASMLTACGVEGPGPREIRGGMVDMSVDFAGPADLLPAPCAPKIATGAETLGVNQAKHFYDSGIREQSFFVVRDSRGFYALNDDCPHNHCRAAFNSAALTFDCPCHGSRFNLDGSLLNGPATIPLKLFPMKRLTNGQLEVDICRFTTDRNGRVT